MEATIHNLYQNDFCTIKNFLCNCNTCTSPKVEYQEHFSFCYVRTGTFRFKSFNGDWDSYNGFTLLNKPGYEYRVAHRHTIPDQCTIFAFKEDFFQELRELHGVALHAFLNKCDLASILVRNTPLMDHLHSLLFDPVETNAHSLRVDWLITEFISEVFERLEPLTSHKLPGTQLSNLSKIEGAKHYMSRRYMESMSLSDLASKVGMSVYHFARVFKLLTKYSPYDYLLKFRMAHAKYLLDNSSETIQDIAFQSGFNDPYNFATSFRKFNGMAPSKYRMSKM